MVWSTGDVFKWQEVRKKKRKREGLCACTFEGGRKRKRGKTEIEKGNKKEYVKRSNIILQFTDTN